MKLSLEKEKANLEEEKSYNLRLLELNETKENEVFQIKERHGTYISSILLFLAHQLVIFKTVSYEK